jgi:hypothetical protein
MKGISNILVLFITLSLISCKKEKETEDDGAIRYRYFNLEHNGWKSREHIQTIDNISYKATEVPSPYYILNTIGNDDLFEADSIEQANKKERIIEFQFYQQDEKDLLKEEFTSLNYDESVKYMSFSIEKDFYVVTSKKDTIQCAGATFERNFKIAPYHKIILFFSDIPPGDKIQLVYQDRLFKKGTLKFKFEEKITKLLL